MKFLLPVILIFTSAFACIETKTAREFTVKESILNEKVTLSPREWSSWPFRVKEQGSRVNGSFDQETDKGYPIMFYVTDPDSAVTLQEKNVGSYNYKSINSRGSIYARAVLKDLDPGNYVFLFHNESETEAISINIRMSLER